MIKNNLILTICLAIISCSPKKNVDYVEVSKLIVNDTIYPKVNTLTDLFIFNLSSSFRIYNDYLIITENIDGQFIHILDKNTGTHLKSLISFGRGPAEILMTPFINVDKNTGEVLLLEPNTHKLIEFFIDSIIIDKDITRNIKSRYVNYGNSNFVKTSNNIIASNKLNEAEQKFERFHIINSDSIAGKYISYPIFNDDDSDIISSLYILNSVIDISSNYDKLVSVLRNGAVMEIFDVDSTNISLSKRNTYIRPKYIIDQGCPIETEESTLGFKDLYVTSNKIYTIFAGVGAFNWKGHLNKIIEFDFEGNPLRVIKIDNKYNLFNICVDEFNNRIYAIVEMKDEDNKIIYFDI